MVSIPFAFPAYVFTGYPFRTRNPPFLLSKNTFLLEVVKYNTSTTLFLKNRETFAERTGLEPATPCVVPDKGYKPFKVYIIRTVNY